MEYVVIQSINALVFAVILLMSGLGLTVVMSLMNFINLAHGSLVLLGSYVAVFWLAIGAPWYLAFPAAFLSGAVAGAVLDRFPFRLFYARTHLMQVLLTFGLSVVFADLMRWGFGAGVATPRLPDVLRGVVFILDTPFPVYRLFVLGAGALLALGLWYLFDRTIWGAVVRACVVDRGAVESLGINTQHVFTLVLALACGLGALSGALGSGIMAAYPGLDEEVLILAFIVVVVGGLGSFSGLALSSLVLGFAMTFSKMIDPEFSNLMSLGAAAAILIVRPNGLVAPVTRQV
ncbi:branched-chain amino acid ABC transporter permease [Azospirillum sp.]|uniref:branched-chain amino acid ABC transporter permease n=1 Tax=Azospirillum sp. TaxID=34012 RepID=UPI002D3F0D31|nr:branched-chain amino acid ABC transporter permease [Azospirillum sp.]HYD71187.1 branched-chain amino acid ABC transporter permease [Azospirillum sp.]